MGSSSGGMSHERMVGTFLPEGRLAVTKQSNNLNRYSGSLSRQSPSVIILQDTAKQYELDFYNMTHGDDPRRRGHAAVTTSHEFQWEPMFLAYAVAFSGA